MAETRTWPELGEELAFKALDTVQTRLWEHSQGLIDTAALKACLASIHDTIVGLTSMDVPDVIVSIRKELGLL